nr:HNH endonuclease [Candidatus Prometheoarchaeum syntrophicum]
MKKKTRKKIVRVECYLKSKKIRINSDKKKPYVALLYNEPETGKFKRFFVNNKTNIWDNKHKKYAILFEFLAPIGFIIEFRYREGAYTPKKYYQVRKSERHYHLKAISQERAYILSKKISRKLSKENRQFRPIPADVRLKVWHRDQGQCVNCGDKKELQFDHIIPFSWGGSNTAENLQILCKKCNLKKSSHLTIPRGNRLALSSKKTYISNSKKHPFFAQ